MTNQVCCRPLKLPPSLKEDISLFDTPEVVEPQAKKRKLNYISRNNEGKYKCRQCDYEASRSSHLRTHVEAIHEGVRYPCNKCDFKATTKSILKTHKHKESKHEGVCYSL